MPTSQYSRRSPSPRYLELRALYERMHLEGEAARNLAPAQTYAGGSLPPQAERIKKLIDRYGAKTLLDYGSGKGRQYGPAAVELPGGRVYPDIPSYWGVESLRCYDPAYPEFAELPRGTFDGVISTDVLEHCPEEDVPWIVQEIFSFARKFVFASISCMSAQATLPNGENAHCTVKPVAWWKSVFQHIATAHPHLRFYVILSQKSRNSDGEKQRLLTLVHNETDEPPQLV